MKQAHRCGACPSDIGGETILSNIPCTILFDTNTFTSRQSLSFLSIAVFTILRNTQSILSFPLDCLFRGEMLKPDSVSFC